MIIVLLGPQGSGKDTQGKLLSEKYNIPLVSVGQEFRNAIESNSVLGNQVKEYVESGNLVPDEICNALIQERLSKSDCDNGVIIDGSPRTANQAIMLDYWYWGKNLEVSKVFYLQISDDEIVNRLQSRVKEAIEKGEKPRGDDLDEKIIRQRVHNFKSFIQLIKMYYQIRGKFYEIDGMPSIENIFKDLVSRIDERNN
ncbi:MAG: nucleoside monophosphate kinase [bacterium]